MTSGGNGSSATTFCLISAPVASALTAVWCRKFSGMITSVSRTSGVLSEGNSSSSSGSAGAASASVCVPAGGAPGGIEHPRRPPRGGPARRDPPHRPSRDARASRPRRGGSRRDRPRRGCSQHRARRRPPPPRPRPTRSSSERAREPNATWRRVPPPAPEPRFGPRKCIRDTRVFLSRPLESAWSSRNSGSASAEFEPSFRPSSRAGDADVRDAPPWPTREASARTCSTTATGTTRSSRMASPSPTGCARGALARAALFPPSGGPSLGGGSRRARASPGDRARGRVPATRPDEGSLARLPDTSPSPPRITPRLTPRPRRRRGPRLARRRRRPQVEKVLHRGKSKFQTVEVVNTKPFGSLLITDGLMQSSEDDEYVYHQSLVHPAMAAHPDPKKVFIAGGGEVRPRSRLSRFARVPVSVVVAG